MALFHCRPHRRVFINQDQWTCPSRSQCRRRMRPRSRPEERSKSGKRPFPNDVPSYEARSFIPFPGPHPQTAGVEDSRFAPSPSVSHSRESSSATSVVEEKGSSSVFRTLLEEFSPPSEGGPCAQSSARRGVASRELPDVRGHRLRLASWSGPLW